MYIKTIQLLLSVVFIFYVFSSLITLGNIDFNVMVILFWKKLQFFVNCATFFILKVTEFYAYM